MSLTVKAYFVGGFIEFPVPAKGWRKLSRAMEEGRVVTIQADNCELILDCSKIIGMQRPYDSTAPEQSAEQRERPEHVEAWHERQSRSCPSHYR